MYRMATNSVKNRKILRVNEIVELAFFLLGERRVEV
jgi:hypothetical protein